LQTKKKGAIRKLVCVANQIFAAKELIYSFVINHLAWFSSPLPGPSLLQANSVRGPTHAARLGTAHRRKSLR
jgi:hypothetical protein